MLYCVIITHVRDAGLIMMLRLGCVMFHNSPSFATTVKRRPDAHEIGLYVSYDATRFLVMSSDTFALLSYNHHLQHVIYICYKPKEVLQYT